MEALDRESQQRAIDNIRHVARTLPKSVGSYHRSTLYEAANSLAVALGLNQLNPAIDNPEPTR